MHLIKNIITGLLEPKNSLSQGNDFISYSIPYIVIRWTFLEHSLVISSLNTGFFKFKIYNIPKQIIWKVSVENKKNKKKELKI